MGPSEEAGERESVAGRGGQEGSVRQRERKGGMLYNYIGRGREGGTGTSQRGSVRKRERKGGMLYRREGRRDWNKSKKEC